MSRTWVMTKTKKQQKMTFLKIVSVRTFKYANIIISSGRSYLIWCKIKL